MTGRDGQQADDGRAPVTGILVSANVVVQLILAALLIESPENIGRVFEILQTFGLVPERFWSGAFWQPLTSMFVHTVVLGLDLNADGTFRGAVPSQLQMAASVFSWGSIHVGANMVAVWSLGRAMEQTLGSFRFGGLYFISGLGGAFLTLALDSGGPFAGKITVGASGGVVGILGALAVFYPHSRLLVFFVPMEARTAALGLGAISLFFLVGAERGFLSHTGHLGGLVAGLVYARLVLQRQVTREQLGSLPFGMERLWSGKSKHRFKAPPGEDPLAPDPNARVVYDSRTGRYVYKHF